VNLLQEIIYQNPPEQLTKKQAKLLKLHREEHQGKKVLNSSQDNIVRQVNNAEERLITT
jgi:hypothetical protein